MSSGEMAEIVSRIGLRPEAMRVALHRLRRDGWVVSRRQGRQSFFRLSPMARRETQAVADTVYGVRRPQGPLRLVIAPPGGAEEIGLSLGRGISLVLGDAGAGLVSHPEGDWPDWVRSRLMEAVCEDEMQGLEKALAEVSIDTIPPADQGSLRLLVLHGWRRLVLRVRPEAEAALGEAAAVGRLRLRVRDLLSQLETARSGT